MTFDNILHFAVLVDYRITALVVMYFLYLVTKAKELNPFVRLISGILLVIEVFSTAIMLYTQFTS